MRQNIYKKTERAQFTGEGWQGSTGKCLVCDWLGCSGNQTSVALKDKVVRVSIAWFYESLYYYPIRNQAISRCVVVWLMCRTLSHEKALQLKSNDSTLVDAIQTAGRDVRTS